MHWVAQRNIHELPLTIDLGCNWCGNCQRFSNFIWVLHFRDGPHRKNKKATKFQGKLSEIDQVGNISVHVSWHRNRVNFLASWRIYKICFREPQLGADYRHIAIVDHTPFSDLLWWVLHPFGRRQRFFTGRGSDYLLDVISNAKERVFWHSLPPTQNIPEQWVQTVCNAN
jgi:hypothetical protein